MVTSQDLLKRQFDFLHITKYHEQGYKGKDIVILNTEDVGGHGDMTNGVIKTFAPEAIVINGMISAKTSNGEVEYFYIVIDGIQYDFEEAIKKFNVKITTTSLSGTTPENLLLRLKDIQKRTGLIMFCSAGNDASIGVTGKFTKNNTAIAVGSAIISSTGKVTRRTYSAIGPEVDFMTFLGYGSGTSAASPSLAGQTACLLSKYGDFNQDECFEILKDCCIDLGDTGDDDYFGWGIPILPLTEKLEVLDKLRGADEMQFKDVEDTRWSKAAIDRCVAEGLLVGFEDGTFKPTETVTREQFAIILTRILDKIEGRM